MANLERVDLATGQVPTETDWEDWFNRAIDYLNSGIPPGDLQKTAGKLAVDISGDAATLNGKTADQIAAGDFPEVKKTLIDVITGGSGLILNGGVATKNGTTANQLDITAVIAIQKVTATGYIDRVELNAASKTTTLANQTYYLDVVPDASDYSWDTSHPVGDYVTLATVTTDASANIATVLDTRPLFAKLLDGMDAVVLAEDFVVGDVDQASTPAGNITKNDKHGIKSAISWIANRIKAITGATNWWESPVKTIAQLNNDIGAIISVPSGAIMMWSGTIASIPAGWALCNGQNGTPNLTDRFILSVASDQENPGATGGSHSVTLTENEIPSHTHTGSTGSAGAHTHDATTGWSGSSGPLVLGAGDPRGTATTESAGAHIHTVTIGATGSGQAHENRPAFYKLAFIMKL